MSIETLEVAPPEVKGNNVDKEFYSEVVNTLKTWRGQPDRLSERKKELLERYPEGNDEIEVLFNLPECDRIIQEIKRVESGERSISSKERIKNYRTLTEFNCSLTRILIKNKDNPENLSRLWNNFNNQEISPLNRDDKKAIRRGLTGQSAIYQLLEELGYNPELPTTDEDAFAKIDLWCHNPEAIVQIKTREHLKEGIVELKEVSMSAVKCGENYFSSHRLEDIAHVKGSTKSLSEFLDRKIQSLVIYLPDHYFDPLTGEPTSECIEKLGPKIRGKIGPPHQKQ